MDLLSDCFSQDFTSPVSYSGYNFFYEVILQDIQSQISTVLFKQYGNSLPIFSSSQLEASSTASALTTSALCPAPAAPRPSATCHEAQIIISTQWRRRCGHTGVQPLGCLSPFAPLSLAETCFKSCSKRSPAYTRPLPCSAAPAPCWLQGHLFGTKHDSVAVSVWVRE